MHLSSVHWVHNLWSDGIFPGQSFGISGGLWLCLPWVRDRMTTSTAVQVYWIDRFQSITRLKLPRFLAPNSNPPKNNWPWKFWNGSLFQVALVCHVAQVTIEGGDHWPGFSDGAFSMHPAPSKIITMKIWPRRVMILGLKFGFRLMFEMHYLHV